MLRSGAETSGDARKWIVDRLISLGLTEREAEVLTWIARGKGNYEIGVILGARPRTIGKHVERILTKLNVENRDCRCCNRLYGVQPTLRFILDRRHFVSVAAAALRASPLEQDSFSLCCPSSVFVAS
jgi:DNA-binding NarL/FixJ family response regulator